MKTKHSLLLFAAAALMAVSCDYDPIETEMSYPDIFTLEDVAGIIASLPMDETHLAEVYEAVNSSSSNGYDEEYMFSDLISNPGSGVGELEVESRAGAVGEASVTKAPYADRPLRELLADYFRDNPVNSPLTKSAVSVETCLRTLQASDIQIYWPYSEDWDGSLYPAITYAPEDDEADSNEAYRLRRLSDGSMQIDTLIVDEKYAMENPVWVINRNVDAEFEPVQNLFLDEDEAEAMAAALKSEGSGEYSDGSFLYIRAFKALRNYDSWFGGASEFAIKCGAVNGFRATTEEDLSKYRPAVTDCMIVVKRKQIGLTLPLGVLLLTDYTPQMENMAFLITEDDGGETESWKCEATLKIKSKSFGVELEIPYRDKDDIVWRGQLSRSFFEKAASPVVCDRFGDVYVTFELR